MSGILKKIKKRCVLALARRIPDCKNISPLLTNSLDRNLTLREKIIMRMHLFTCGACVNYLANLKFMSDVFREQERRIANEEFSVKLSREAQERLKNAVRPNRSLKSD